jgi:hypothetical protein
MNLSVPRELDSPAVIADVVGGETLIINLNTGSYYVVAPEGQQVWSALSSGVPASALLDGPDDPREAPLRQYMTVVVSAGLLRETATPTAVTPKEATIPQWTAQNLVIEEHTDMADLLGLDPIHDADENVGWPMAAGGND